MFIYIFFLWISCCAASQAQEIKKADAQTQTTGTLSTSVGSYIELATPPRAIPDPSPQRCSAFGCHIIAPKPVRAVKVGDEEKKDGVVTALPTTAPDAYSDYDDAFGDPIAGAAVNDEESDEWSEELFILSLSDDENVDE